MVCQTSWEVFRLYLRVDTGLTAVHLVSSSFLGFSGFMDERHQGLLCISRVTASARSITAMA
jgi:hypothetical protein